MGQACALLRVTACGALEMLPTCQTLAGSAGVAYTWCSGGK